MNEHLCLLVGLHFQSSVNTTVGVLDLVTVSISPELNDFWLIMCFDAPESTTNSRSSGLMVDAGAGIPFSMGI